MSLWLRPENLEHGGGGADGLGDGGGDVLGEQDAMCPGDVEGLLDDVRGGEFAVCDVFGGFDSPEGHEVFGLGGEGVAFCVGVGGGGLVEQVADEFGAIAVHGWCLSLSSL